MNSKTTWIYVAIAAAVFALIVLVEQPLRKKAHIAASTKVFPGFNPALATRVEVRPSEQPEIVAQLTNGSWILTSPLAYPAAAPYIGSLLQALEQLDWHTYISPEELKDRPKAHEEFGFSAPVSSLSIQQDNSVLNLLIGTNTPVGGQIYLQVLGDVGVYVVDAELLNFIPVADSDWRDTTLLRITNAITSVKSRAGNKVLDLTITNNSWRLPQSRADNTKVNALLEKTLALQVEQFEADNPSDLEPFGLHTPEMELTFGSGTNVVAVLQIGKTPTNNPAQVFAKIQNGTHVFRVLQEVLAEWRSSNTNFVDRRLTSFLPESIQQIEVVGTDQFMMARTNGHWRIPSLTNLPVDAGLVNDVLSSLNRAEVEIEKEVVTDFASYGLASPALRYTLYTAGTPSNSIVAQTDFGTSQTGKIFVRRLDEYPDTVKSIHPEHFARLPQASWQFRDRQIWNFGSNDVVSVEIQQAGRKRKLVRNAQGEWSFANPFSFAEALHRLGDLKAVFWIAKDEKDPARFGFKEADHRILIEIKRGDKIESLPLEFGGFSEFGTRYAATMMDGVRMVFEFPWPLFFEVQDSLSIPIK